MTGRREIRAALVAGLVPLALSEILALSNLIESQFGTRALVGNSGEFFRLEALDGLIAFGMSLPIYIAIATLGARLTKPWLPYGVAVLLPLVADEVLSQLPFFSPREGHFGAIWLFGPTVAVVGVLTVAYVRRRGRRDSSPPISPVAEQKLTRGP